MFIISNTCGVCFRFPFFFFLTLFPGVCDNGRVLAVIKRCLPDPGGCITGRNPCLPGDGSGPLLDRRISTLRVRELLRHVAPHFSLAQVPVAPSSSAGNSLHTPLHPRHHILGAETILKKNKFTFGSCLSAFLLSRKVVEKTSERCEGSRGDGFEPAPGRTRSGGKLGWWWREESCSVRSTENKYAFF